MAHFLAPMDAMFLHLESPSMLAHVAGLQIFSLSGESSDDFLRHLVVEMRSTRDLAAPWNLKLKRSVLRRLFPSLATGQHADQIGRRSCGGGRGRSELCAGVGQLFKTKKT